MKFFVKDHLFIKEEDTNDWDFVKHFLAASLEVTLSLERMPKKFENTMRRKKRLTK